MASPSPGGVVVTRWSSAGCSMFDDRPNPLAERYRALIGPLPVVLAFQTVMELRFGALRVDWGELHRRPPARRVPGISRRGVQGRSRAAPDHRERRMISSSMPGRPVTAGSVHAGVNMARAIAEKSGLRRGRHLAGGRRPGGRLGRWPGGGAAPCRAPSRRRPRAPPAARAPLAFRPFPFSLLLRDSSCEATVGRRDASPARRGSCRPGCPTRRSRRTGGERPGRWRSTGEQVGAQVVVGGPLDRFDHVPVQGVVGGVAEVVDPVVGVVAQLDDQAFASVGQRRADGQDFR